MPTRAEILASIRNIARDKLDSTAGIEEIGPDTLLTKGGLELDSFAIVELITQLEAQFAFEFRESDFREEHFESIGALSDLVNRCVNG